MAKGSDFERTISKYLTKWLTGQDKEYHFWRMPGSGSIATVNEANKNLSGDIKGLTIESEEIMKNWSIECKTGYPNTSFWQHFKNIKNFNFRDFWIQCQNDASKGNKNSMLFYRKKGKGVIVGISKKILGKMPKKLKDKPYIVISWNADNDIDDVVLFDMNDFFDNVNPKQLKGIK